MLNASAYTSISLQGSSSAYSIELFRFRCVPDIGVNGDVYGSILNDTYTFSFLEEFTNFHNYIFKFVITDMAHDSSNGGTVTCYINDEQKGSVVMPADKTLLFPLTLDISHDGGQSLPNTTAVSEDIKLDITVE